MNKSAACVAILALIFSAALRAQQQPSHLQDMNGPQSDCSELRTCLEKMHAAMRSIDASGDNDVDFVRLMLPHHQAAIDMAKLQLMHGKDPQVRRLAQEIITDQQSEIQLMQLWLKQHHPQK